MRAELASIDDPAARNAFARSAAGAALSEGLGIRLGFALAAGALVAAVTVIASRAQLDAAGPGVLPVTVPIPAAILLVIAAVAAVLTRSMRGGITVGLWAMVTSFVALWIVLAVEGAVWMQRHGVFILDGDPPKTAVDSATVAFDVFTTGMWVGHIAMWAPAILLGAAIGSWAARWRSPLVRENLPVA